MRKFVSKAGYTGNTDEIIAVARDIMNKSYQDYLAKMKEKVG